MAHSVDARANNPANILRDTLEKAENLVVAPSAQNIENLLLLLDRIEQQFEELTQNGSDLRPEESRWQSLLRRISSKPQPLAAAASAAGGMSRLRTQHPPAESFWWRLDEEVTRRRIRAARSAVTTIGSVIAVLAFLYWGINFFFPPDPETLMMVETTSQIDDFILNGEWAEALLVIDETKKQLPDNPELLLWESTLAERVGDMARAEASLEHAQEILADQPIPLWITLGQQRMQVGNLAGAEEAANRVIEIDPDEPQAYFLLGSVAEANGDFPAAIELFDKTFVLAEDDNPQLAVIAKVRMGGLLQNPFGGLPQTEETPAANP